MSSSTNRQEERRALDRKFARLDKRFNINLKSIKDLRRYVDRGFAKLEKEMERYEKHLGRSLDVSMTNEKRLRLLEKSLGLR